MAFAATGHLPFGGGSYEQIFYRIVSGRADLDGVPAPLIPLISAALARDPAHRPSASWLSQQAAALDLSAASASPTQTTTYPGPQPNGANAANEANRANGINGANQANGINGANAANQANGING